MTTAWPIPSRLLAGALCFFCSISASGADARGPARLYGVIDVDFVGHDIAFSVELGGDHAVMYYGWGRDLDEIEGMAVDREGELYLFSESGVVKKVDLGQPNGAPLTVVRSGRFDFTSATTRPADGMIELYDARGRQLVTLDPRTDTFGPAAAHRRLPRAPALDGLARTATRLYGTATAGEAAALYADTGGVFRPVCAGRLRLPIDVQAIERLTDSTLVLARISITDTNRIMLHVESLEPDGCVLRQLFTTELDRERIRGFLKPGNDLDRVLRQARSMRRSPEIEAIAVHGSGG
jgi:hypothetical protein